MDEVVINKLLEEADAWLLAVNQLQQCLEVGNWESFDDYQPIRDDAVLRYQILAASSGISTLKEPSKSLLHNKLLAIQQAEMVLTTRMEEYQREVTDSLRSVKMEDALIRRYGADGS